MGVDKKQVIWVSQDQNHSFFKDEDLPEVFELLLSPYFINATSHSEPGVDAPFIANFYCSNPWPAYGRIVEIVGPAVKEHTFYDDSLIPSRRRGSIFTENSSAILIRYNGQDAGVLTENQTLWATDWTHCYNLRPITEIIINYLRDNGFLRPVSSYEEEDSTVYPEEFSITMGCDPEFELVNTNKVVEFPPDILGREFHEDFPEIGNIGLDGSSEVVELRPSPGSPETVVTNIKGLLEKFTFHEPSIGLSLSPSSDRYPCGGHIHIGVDPFPSGNLFDRLASVLDDFIGHPCFHLNGENRGRGYGKIHDWRYQDHGMEYRTPPATVFRNPEFARVVLQLTYNIAYIFANTRKLEYNFPITELDLLTVGGLSVEDAQLFLEECNGPKPNATECLLAAWDVPIQKPKYKLQFAFGNEWDPQVVDFVDSCAKLVEPDKNLNIRLFGLKEERGNVYTFKVKRRGLCEHPNASTSSFGFSYKFRKGQETKEKMVQVMRTLLTILGITQMPDIPVPSAGISSPLIIPHTAVQPGYIAQQGDTFPEGTVFEFVSYEHESHYELRWENGIAFLWNLTWGRRWGNTTIPSPNRNEIPATEIIYAFHRSHTYLRMRVISSRKNWDSVARIGHRVCIGEVFPVGTEFTGRYAYDTIHLRLDCRLGRYSLWVYEWERDYGPNYSSAIANPMSIVRSSSVSDITVSGFASS